MIIRHTPRYFLFKKLKDHNTYEFNSVREFLTSDYNSFKGYGADCELKALRVVHKEVRGEINPTINFRLHDLRRDGIDVVYFRDNIIRIIAKPLIAKVEDSTWNRLLECENNSLVDIHFKVKGIVRPYYHLVHMDRV